MSSIWNKITDLASQVTGVLGITHGGTGQATASAAFGALSPLTTKGDVLGFSSANDRVPIGSDTQVLTADSAQTLGVKWATPTTGTVTSVAMTVPTFLSVGGSPVTSTGTLAVSLSGTALPVLNGGTGQTTAAAAFGGLSPLTTKGDVLGFSTVNDRLPVGSNTQVLTADSTQTLGVKWATPTTGTVTSVAMTVPSFLSISGSPVTGSGTLAVSLSGTALPVANGGTGITSGTSGGIPYYSGSTTIASTAQLPANAVVFGGGAGGAPSFATVNSSATNKYMQQVSSGAPNFAVIAAADLPAASSSAQGAVSREQTTTSTGALTGLTSPPTITVTMTRIGNVVSFTVPVLPSLYTKSGTSGIGLPALAVGYRPTSMVVFVAGTVLNNVYAFNSFALDTDGSLTLLSGAGRSNITTGTTNCGWDVDFGFSFVIR